MITDKPMRFLSGAGLLFICLAIIGGAKLLHAQNMAGSIFGKVTDSTRADLFDVTVTVANSAAGVSRHVKTDHQGAYSIDSLPLGSYTVHAEGEGLKTVSMKVELAAGENKTVNLVS